MWRHLSPGCTGKVAEAAPSQGRDEGSHSNRASLSMQAQRALGDFEMSDHRENVYSTATGMDYPAHEQQYKTFIKIGMIASGAVATIVILMAIFLT